LNQANVSNHMPAASGSLGFQTHCLAEDRRSVMKEGGWLHSVAHVVRRRVWGWQIQMSWTKNTQSWHIFPPLVIRVEGWEKQS
jgi:hypothetical protein